jgi:hypothetical protein
MVATEGVPDVQSTLFVMSCVEESEKVPIAVNCSVCPLATLGLEGVMAMDTRTPAVTVSVVDPETPLKEALIFELPGVKLVASPVELIVATERVSDVHVAVFVRS